MACRFIEKFTYILWFYLYNVARVVDMHHKIITYLLISSISPYYIFIPNFTVEAQLSMNFVCMELFAVLRNDRGCNFRYWHFTQRRFNRLQRCNLFIFIEQIFLKINFLCVSQLNLFCLLFQFILQHFILRLQFTNLLLLLKQMLFQISHFQDNSTIPDKVVDRRV